MSSASKRLIDRFNDPSAWDHVGEEFPVMIEHTMCEFADGTKHAVVKGKEIPQGAKILYDVDAARIERIYRNAKRNFELDKPIKLFREHSNIPGSERVGWYGEPKLADWNGLKAVVTKRYVEKGKGEAIKGYSERSPEYFPRVDELSGVALLPPNKEPRLAMGVELESYSGEREVCVMYAGDLLPEYYGASKKVETESRSEKKPSATPNLDHLDHPAGKWARRAYQSAKRVHHRQTSSKAFASTWSALSGEGSHADAAAAHLTAASVHGSTASGEENEKRYMAHRSAHHRHLKAAMEHMKADDGVMKSHKEWHDTVSGMYKDDLAEKYAMDGDMNVQTPTPQPPDPTGVPNGAEVKLSPEEQSAAALVVEAMAGSPDLLKRIATALFQSVPEFGYLQAMASQAMSQTPVPSPPPPAAAPSPQGGPGVPPASPPPQMMASDQAREEYEAKLAEAESALNRAKAEKQSAEAALAKSETARIMAGWDAEGVKYNRERESASLFSMSPTERASHDKHVREFYAKSGDKAPVGGPAIPIAGVDTMVMETYSPSAKEIEKVLYEKGWSPTDNKKWDEAAQIAKQNRFATAK